MFRSVVIALSTCSILVACGGNGSGDNSVANDSASVVSNESNEQQVIPATNSSSNTAAISVPEYCARPPVSDLGGKWVGTLRNPRGDNVFCEYDVIVNIDASTANTYLCLMTGSIEYTAIRPGNMPVTDCEVHTGEVVDVDVNLNSLFEMSLQEGTTDIVNGQLYITADIAYPLSIQTVPLDNSYLLTESEIENPLNYVLLLQLNDDRTLTDGYEPQGNLGVLRLGVPE